MAVITEQDIPGLEEDRKLLKEIIGFHERGMAIKRLPSGEYEVDPETFFVIVPGEAEKGPENKQGLAWFRKKWDGVRFCCNCFE